jgi:hypothetical protein
MSPINIVHDLGIESIGLENKAWCCSMQFAIFTVKEHAYDTGQVELVECNQLK